MILAQARYYLSTICALTLDSSLLYSTKSSGDDRSESILLPSRPRQRTPEAALSLFANSDRPRKARSQSTIFVAAGRPARSYEVGGQGS